jgi:hypothetical protein
MLYLTIIGGAFIAWLILVFLFTPALQLRLRARPHALRRNNP